MYLSLDRNLVYSDKVVRSSSFSTYRHDCGRDCRSAVLRGNHHCDVVLWSMWSELGGAAQDVVDVVWWSELGGAAWDVVDVVWWTARSAHLKACRDLPDSSDGLLDGSAWSARRGLLDGSMRALSS